MENKVKDNREEQRIERDKHKILNDALFDILEYSASMGENKIPSNENIQKEYDRYLQAMQEYADLRCKELNGRVAELEKDSPFLFFIIDKNDFRSVGIFLKEPEVYRGLSFKQDNTGWNISPISVGRTACELQIESGVYELTKDHEAAMNFASIKNHLT